MKINLLRKALMENKRNNIIKVFVMCLLVISLSITASASYKEYNLGYDQIGNLRQGLDRYIEYNEFNQVLRVRDGNANGTILEEYFYDQNGERVRKNGYWDNQTTYYISDSYIEVVNDTGVYQYVYYHEDDTLVGRKDPDGRKYSYHPDHLGSTDLVTNESGNVIEETTYEPHGEVIDGGDSRFLFTSKELDKGTGLYYFIGRYYDPLSMFYTQCDQIKPDVYKPQALNCYAYVLNNPYKYVDPNGKEPVEASIILISVITFGSIGFTYGFFSTLGEHYRAGAPIKTALKSSLESGVKHTSAAIITTLSIELLKTEVPFVAESPAIEAGLTYGIEQEILKSKDFEKTQLPKKSQYSTNKKTDQFIKDIKNFYEKDKIQNTINQNNANPSTQVRDNTNLAPNLPVKNSLRPLISSGKNMGSGINKRQRSYPRFGSRRRR